MRSVIFHIDMNAYFASVATAMRSDLDGLPVAVSHSLANNGMIVTANYEARAYGIHAAMLNQEAYRKCPNLVIIESDFTSYHRFTKKIFNLIREYSIYLEPASIDECYVDVTEIIQKFKRPLDLAIIIQNRILKEIGIPCSIGIASNKFLAKMASDMQKPLGITVLRKTELADKLWCLPIQEMYGIGIKSSEKLIQSGIHTIGDLVDENNFQKIKTLLGPIGEQFILNAKGFDVSPISYNETVQSISQSKTYANPLENEESIISEIKLMLKKICEKAQAKNQKGKHITLMLRYLNGKSIIRSTTLSQYENTYHILLEQILTLFDKHYHQQSIKLLGVGLGSLTDSQHVVQQLSIFESTQKIDIKTLLNEKYNTHLIYLNELED